MKVYLYNEMNSSNIGDQLIGKVIVHYLKKHNVEVITKRKNPPGNMLQKQVTRFLSVIEDYQNINNADFVIIGGGNLIMDINIVGSRWALHHFLISAMSNILGKDLYYFCVGVNPLSKRISRVLYRYALKSAKSIVTRDESSRLYVEKLTGRNDVEIIADPVLLISEINKRKGNDEKNGIGICPVQLYPGITNNIDAYRFFVLVYQRLIKRFLEQKIPVHLFLNGRNIDRQVFDDIVEGIQVENDLFHTRIEFPDTAEYLAFLTGKQLIISSRLHPIIIASSYRVPFIGIGVQTKIKSFFDDQSISSGYIDFLDYLKTDKSKDVDALLDDIMNEIKTLTSSNQVVNLPNIIEGYLSMLVTSEIQA